MRGCAETLSEKIHKKPFIVVASGGPGGLRTQEKLSTVCNHSCSEYFTTCMHAFSIKLKILN